MPPKDASTFNEISLDSLVSPPCRTDEGAKLEFKGYRDEQPRKKLEELRRSQSTVPPQNVYGKAAGMPLILFGIVGLTCIYITLRHALRDSGEYLIVDQSFCPDGTKSGTRECSRPDLFSFQVGSGLLICFCGLKGMKTWYITKTVHHKIPDTPEGRLYGYLPEASTIAAAQLIFQAWDFIISLTIAEHATAIMLCHHMAAALLSWFSLRFQYLHYYGIFFLGLSEFSSIFLLFLDLAKYFPPQEGTTFKLLAETLFGPGFAITFFIFRVFLWWKVSATLWKDALYVLSSGRSEQFRPGQNYVLYIYLVSNIALGFLQLFWSTIIIEEAAKVISS